MRHARTYIQHTTHARAHISHTWTELAVEIHHNRPGVIPATATALGKYSFYKVADDGLTLHLWHIVRTRKY